MSEEKENKKRKSRFDVKPEEINEEKEISYYFKEYSLSTQQQTTNIKNIKNENNLNENKFQEKLKNSLKKNLEYIRK